MVYSIWGLFGYVKKKDTPISPQCVASDNLVRENSPESVQEEATTSLSSASDGTVFSFKLDGPEVFESISNGNTQNAEHQVPMNNNRSSESQEEDTMANNSEENDLDRELEEKFDGSGFISSGVKTMPKFNTARRSSKRFVIGDEMDEDATTPETEVLLTVPNPEWLKASSKLKPGTTLT